MFLKRFLFVLIALLPFMSCLSLQEKWLSSRTSSFEHQYNINKSDIKTKTIEFLSVHFIQGKCNILTDDTNRLIGTFSFIIDQEYSTYCTTNFIMNFSNGKLQYKLIVQDVYNTIPPVNHYSEYVWGNFEEQIKIAVHNLDNELNQYIINN